MSAGKRRPWVLLGLFCILLNIAAAALNVAAGAEPYWYLLNATGIGFGVVIIMQAPSDV